MRNAIVLSGLVMASACGPAQPELTPGGPRLAAKLEREWRAGDGPGRAAIFSRDGSLLAISSAGGEVALRRAPDWRIVKRFKHPGGATSLAFSPDGRSLYAGGYDGKVRSWDLAAGTEQPALTGATGTVWTIAMSPDGKWIAAAGEDGVARLWRAGGSEPPRALRGHSRNVWEVRFAPGGERLATASFDNSARIWDIAAGKPLTILRGHTQAVVGLDYSPDGRTLATSGDDSTIRLWRTSDGARLRTISGGNHVYDVTFSPDGKWLASAGRARSVVGGFWYDLTGMGRSASPVKLWRAKDGALVTDLPHPTDVMYTDFSADGRHLVTSSEDGKARLWRLSARG